MQVVTLEDLRAFSKCPAYYNFQKTAIQPPISSNLEIIMGVIQKCYLRHTESGYRTDWRTMVGWVDKQIFKDVEISNDEAMTAAKRLAETCLIALRRWYEEEYLKEQASGFVDLKIEQNIDKFIISGTIPLIRLPEDEDCPTIMLISNVELTPTQMYNDIEVRALGWLACKQLNIEAIKIRRYATGPLGGMEPHTLLASPKINKKTEVMILQILYSMKGGVNYPSVTSMCNTCQFKPICHI